MNTWTKYPLRKLRAVRCFHLGTVDLFRRGCRSALAVVICLCAVLLPAQDASAGDQSRPMGGSCSTTFVFTASGAIHFEGTCHLLHLGLTTVEAEQIVSPLPDGTLLITNVAIYTAANGDTLFSNLVGTGGFITQTSVVFSGTETYTGGTGRFADASGSVALVGSAQFTSATGGVGEFTDNGSISY